MKIGVIGYKGKVGKILVDQYECSPLDCDITDLGSIKRAINKVKPDVVVSLAAKSDVEYCEENLEKSYKINVSGVYNLGTITLEKQIPTVIISTDHVFSGKTFFDWETKMWIRKGKYNEDYARCIPVNMYGMQKFAAEVLAMTFDHMKIVRTSYLFDRSRLFPLKESYPAFMKRSFMHIEHFAHALHEYLQRVNNMPPILHISGSKTVSWKKFIKALPKKEVFLMPKFHYKDKKGFAPRPHKAGLDVTLSDAYGLPQYSYKDGIEIL